jgi:lipoprotein NlpD
MPPESRPSVPRKTTPRADKKAYNDDTADAPRSEKAGERAEVVAAAAAVSPAAAAAAGSRVGSTVTATDDEKLSWMWPSDGRIIATFDEGKSKGIDIAGRAGQQVMAAGAGKVMYAGSGIRGYGNLVIVKHSNSLLSAYAHNRAIVVKEGDNVAKGQVIAEMGDSDADTVKLHFEIRQQGKPVDPSRFLPSR